MLKFSFTNAVASASITATTQDPNFPATNAASPERPFQPWKGTSTSAMSLYIDFGAETTLDVIALIRANFVSAIIQGNSVDTWGNPPYNHTVAIARNPLSRRYHHVHAVVGSFAYRYMRINIPTQAPPSDGVGHWLLGGIWGGRWTLPPRGVRYQAARRETIDPVLDMRTLSGAAHRVRLGEPIAHVNAQRQAVLGASAPAYGDELSSWAEIDRQFAAADIALVWWEPADPAQGWIMRHLAQPEWTLDDKRLAASSLDLEEVIAGGGAGV